MVCLAEVLDGLDEGHHQLLVTDELVTLGIHTHQFGEKRFNFLGDDTELTTGKGLRLAFCLFAP